MRAFPCREWLPRAGILVAGLLLLGVGLAGCSQSSGTSEGTGGQNGTAGTGGAAGVTGGSAACGGRWSVPDYLPCSFDNLDHALGRVEPVCREEF